LEDEYLIDSWKEVSLCPITGANQNSSKYYKRHRKNFGGYSTINMLHNDSAMSHGWDIIKKGLQQIPWKLYEGEEPVGERALNGGCGKSLSINAYVSILTVVFML
jgi:hypothetical protein